MLYIYMHVSNFVAWMPFQPTIEQSHDGYVPICFCCVKFADPYNVDDLFSLSQPLPSCKSMLRKITKLYPLVNLQETMEHHHAING